MTRQSSFKRLVRSRMEKTGESYTAARAVLLAADEPKDSEHPALLTSDSKIRERTGRGWEEWFDLLDDWGAQGRKHREIARWVAQREGVSPLAWNVQTIVASYELVRGLREPGQKEDGFAISATKTMAVPVDTLYDAVVDQARRTRWLPESQLRERTATRPKSARFNWADGTTRVNVTFLDKGESKSSVSISHERLADADEAARMKAFWRERLATLKEEVER